MGPMTINNCPELYPPPITSAFKVQLPDGGGKCELGVGSDGGSGTAQILFLGVEKGSDFSFITEKEWKKDLRIGLRIFTPVCMQGKAFGQDY